MLNPFETDAFNMVSLTKSINILPNNYGRVREMNLMPGKGIRTRSIIVEERNGVLNLLPTMPPGSPGTVGKHGKRAARSFVIPHIPHDDSVLPEAYEGIRAFGQENELTAVSQVINDRLQDMRNKHAITLEYLRMGALKGLIADADGTTIYNLFTEFDITKKSVDFELDDAAISTPKKCREVVRHIEQNLKGEVMTEVHCLVSATFFDELIAHTSVKEAYLNYEAAQSILARDVRRKFTFNGITFEEYVGTATDADGTDRPFLVSGYGQAFPMGTMGTFETLFAPADFMETANTLGIELYAKQEPRKFARGIDLHTQSNPLPICYRPAVLVEVKAH